MRSPGAVRRPVRSPAAVQSAFACRRLVVLGVARKSGEGNEGCISFALLSLVSHGFACACLTSFDCPALSRGCLLRRASLAIAVVRFAVLFYILYIYVFV